MQVRGDPERALPAAVRQGGDARQVEVLYRLRQRVNKLVIYKARESGLVPAGFPDSSVSAESLKEPHRSPIGRV